MAVCKSRELSVLCKVVSKGGVTKTAHMAKVGWGGESIFPAIESEVSRRKWNFRGC